MTQLLKIPKINIPVKKKTTSQVGRCVGIDMRHDLICIVELDMRKQQVEFLHNDIKEVASGENNAEILRSMVNQLGMAESPIVTSGPVGSTYTITSTYDGNKPSQKQLEDWGTLEAIHYEKDQHDSDIRDKRVDCGPPNAINARTVSWMAESEATAIVSRIQYAGLQVKAIDSPLLAWQRTYGIPDPTTGIRTVASILDLSHERPYLYVFSDPIGEEIQLQLSNQAEDLATVIVNKLVSLRQTGFITDIPNIHIYGTGPANRITTPTNKPAFIEELISAINKRDSGLEAQYLTVGGIENPAWAFANALATWNHPSSEFMRANLAPRRFAGPNIYGYELSEKDTMPFLGAVLGGVLAYGAGLYGLGLEAASIQASDQNLQQQISAITPRISRVDDLQENLEHLREIDRNAYWLRYSGRLTALRLVQLGNSMPSEAKATDISQSDSGWNIAGRSKKPEVLSDAQDNLTKMSPGLNVRMEDEEDQGNAYSFNMKITDPPKIGSGAKQTQAVLPLQQTVSQ